MIEVRAYFKWKPVTREQALSFARWLFRQMTCVRGDEARVDRINTRHVRGIRFTLEELRP
ncbi:MAG: hypothetical protein IJ773_03955 [Lachnospiraceae bacterium]|nr:hypothetical protein [Acidaminococcaceae bacterium]MBQ9284651.1 hypothetical protein [Acidaminococcaceae bacterium]MBR1812956.1 hypothetical protein [Lachnospiraceae bacterium]